MWFICDMSTVTGSDGGNQSLFGDAAMSSIRVSNPFEPLPSAYKRPYIELRFIFFYNLPVDTPY